MPYRIFMWLLACPLFEPDVLVWLLVIAGYVATLVAAVMGLPCRGAP